MILKILIPPVIGGVIGYITNDIAIKMLFHPRKAVYIGKWKLPFTPGLIPKEKDRIAKSLGNVISEQLLNNETMTNALASEEMLQKLRGGIENFIEKNKSNTSTVEEVLSKLVPDELLQSAMEGLKNSAVNLIYNKISSVDMSEKVSINVLEKLKEKLSMSKLGFFAAMINDDMMVGIAQNISEMLNQYIKENGESLIEEFLGTELDKIKNEPINEIIIKYEEKLPKFIDFIVEEYRSLIERNLTGILKGIDLAKIVEEKISQFSMEQFEELIFSIMKKELKAIVYFGAVLGFVLGWIQVLINAVL